MNFSSLPLLLPHRIVLILPSKKIFYINQVMQDCNELLAGQPEGRTDADADRLPGTAPSVLFLIS